MQRLKTKFANDPNLKVQFEEQRSEFNKAIKDGKYKLSKLVTDGMNTAKVTYTIPVVFHVVLTNPNVVTNAQIQAQLDTLNRDYSGTNGDSSKIPSYFKSLFGKSFLQFCLAQQTPDGDATSGIERVTTTQASFTTNDGVKHSSSGGADIWDSSQVYNVFIFQTLLLLCSNSFPVRRIL